MFQFSSSFSHRSFFFHLDTCNLCSEGNILPSLHCEPPLLLEGVPLHLNVDQLLHHVDPLVHLQQEVSAWVVACTRLGGMGRYTKVRSGGKGETITQGTAQLAGFLNIHWNVLRNVLHIVVQRIILYMNMCFKYSTLALTSFLFSPCHATVLCHGHRPGQ